MYYFVVPLLSIITAFILPILVYWKKTLQLKLFYKKVANKNVATHLLVEGSQGNIETQKLGLETLNIIDQEAIIFSYRFIKYQYDSIDQKFKPVVFNAVQTQLDLINQFGKGLEDDQIEILRQKYGPC